MAETKKAKTKSIEQKILAIQNSIGKLSKDKSNPYHNSKYFDINNVIEALQPMLATHNLLVTQPLVVEGEQQLLQTIVHDTETDAEKVYSMIVPLNDNPQKVGSAITYYRRYSLQSLFLLQAADDDGNKASKPNKAEKTFDKEKTKLEGAKNLIELQKAWGAISGEAKQNAEVLALKNKLKTKFQA